MTTSLSDPKLPSEPAARRHLICFVHKFSLLFQALRLSLTAPQNSIIEKRTDFLSKKKRTDITSWADSIHNQKV